MSNVTKLPTAANTYIRARKSGRLFVVEIVTPVPGKRPLATAVARFGDQDAASSHATEVARQMQRPVRLTATGGAA